MSDPVVRFERVTKTYRLYHRLVQGVKRNLVNLPETLRAFRHARQVALLDVSFEVERGEAMGIVGRNGSGKSTLLSLVSGVLRPTGGTVSCRGRVVPLLDLGSGMHPDLTGRENIILKCVLLGEPLPSARAKAVAVADLAGLGGLLDEPLRTYSLGMTARLGFAVVVNLRADILLIDEVLGSGDAAFRETAWSILADLKRRGTTILVVSHQAQDVTRLCDRVLWLDGHRVRAVGPAAETVAAYAAG